MSVSAIIIDDDNLMRDTLRACLEPLEVTIVGEAQDGRSGVDLACRLSPDLIMLDIIMPEMNGYLALEEIIVRIHKPFVVMMTTVDDEQVASTCRLTGAQDYILKSAPMNETIKRLSRHVEYLKSQK